MEEEVKVVRPMRRDEMNALLAKYIDRSQATAEAAATLRQRVAKGQQIASDPTLTVEQVAGVQAKLAGLAQELREAEWGEMISYALAMAHGVAVSLNDFKQADGWNPPAGSVVRVYMPGICDVAVQVDGYGGEAGAS